MASIMEELDFLLKISWSKLNSRRWLLACILDSKKPTVSPSVTLLGIWKCRYNFCLGVPGIRPMDLEHDG